MPKKGLSFEEKRKRILDLYYDKQEVFNLKELEKIGPKKGVIVQAVKDVNQSLVDDNLVETDKIGIGTFFWALPSMGLQTRENLLKNIDNQMEAQKKKNEELRERLGQEQEQRTAGGVEGTDQDRSQLLQRYRELKSKNESLKKDMSQYKRCDPDRFETQKTEIKKSFDACNRWVDNLFEVNSWIRKKNPALSQPDLEKQFEVLEDLDYLEEYHQWINSGGEQRKAQAAREKAKRQAEAEEIELKKAMEIHQREMERQAEREAEAKAEAEEEARLEALEAKEQARIQAEQEAAQKAGEEAKKKSEEEKPAKPDEDQG